MSKVPEYIDHKKAIEIIAKKFHKTPKEIELIISGFLGYHGIQALLRHQIKFKLPFIGSFDLTEKGKAIKAEKIRKKVESDAVHKKAMKLNK